MFTYLALLLLSLFFSLFLPEFFWYIFFPFICNPFLLTCPTSLRLAGWIWYSCSNICFTMLVQLFPVLGSRRPPLQRMFFCCASWLFCRRMCSIGCLRIFRYYIWGGTMMERVCFSCLPKNNNPERSRNILSPHSCNVVWSQYTTTGGSWIWTLLNKMPFIWWSWWILGNLCLK